MAEGRARKGGVRDGKRLEDAAAGGQRLEDAVDGGKRRQEANDGGERLQEAIGGSKRLQEAWAAGGTLLQEDLRRRDAAERTRRAYGVDVRQFARWAAALGLTPCEVGPREVRRYVASLSEGGAAPTSTARKLAAVRALFSSQREHGLIAHSPADLVATPRRPARLPRALKAQEVARLLDSVPARTPLERRDRALFELAYACGLRAEELVSLRVGGSGDGRRWGPGGRAAVPESVGPAPEHQRRAPAAAQVDDARGRGPRRLATCAAPQLRDPPAGRRRGPALDPGAPGPRQRVHHAGLHSGRVSQAEKRLRAQPPTSLRAE
jgi:integrase